MTSLPRRSITFTAALPCLPAGKGRDLVPLNAENCASSMTPLRARASFSHALLSGKNACVMQNVRPS